MLLCDGCDAGYHTRCLSLSKVPRGEWFCPTCRGTTAAPCRLCGLFETGSNSVTCSVCADTVHTTCLGLGKHSFPGGFFTCADCVLTEAQLEGDPTPAAQDAAANLVRLRAQRVQDSTQSTYAAALHRFVVFGKQQLGLEPKRLLPPARGAAPSRTHVELFVAWATPRYKVSSIRVTLNALIDWCKSKGSPTEPVSCPEIEALMEAAARQQGPAGVPKGKSGMPKDLLALILSHLGDSAKARPHLAPLFSRDATWLLLGFFGMLRRSELVALRLSDVELRPARTGSSAHICLFIRSSKTDQKGEGAQVLISGTSIEGWDLLGKVGRYADLRVKAGATPDSPFLVKWDTDSSALSRAGLANGEALSQRLKQYLTELRARHPCLAALNPEDFAMHSLRRGGVIAAWAAGIDVERIKTHGRWKSDAVRAYMTATNHIKLTTTQRM
jgi:hypothetical protein